MFDTEQFCEAAHAGRAVDAAGLARHLCSFDSVIVWGAGKLGSAIGAQLVEMAVPVSAYWDRSSEQIVELNGVPVTEPFTGDHDRARTIVVACISNGSTGGDWTRRELSRAGYPHSLPGMVLYEGLLCPLDLDTGVDPGVCIRAKACNVCACDRLLSLLRRDAAAGDDLRLDFNVITFIVNQKCSLSCHHCGQYMNSYPGDERVNLPLDRITEDIDRFFDAADVVGVVSIIGGEPFLHPEIGAIVRHVLCKNRFGVLDITTNGIWKLDPARLDEIRNDRVRVTFSYYPDALTSKQRDLFQRNRELVQSKGLSCSVGVPVWVMPSSLRDKGHSVDRMIEMKRSCDGIRLCMSVKNGRFFPCSKAEPLHSLRVAVYETDYVDMRSTSPEELRRKMHDLRAAAYYRSCSHCGGDAGQVLRYAGEQGTSDRYSL